VFEVRAVAIGGTPPVSTFRIPDVPAERDEGGRSATIEQVRRAVGFDPVAPERIDGLGLYRAVLPESPAADAVLTYASGLSWVKIGETHARSGEAFFGPVGPHARRIEVAGVGTAYFQPGSTRHGPRLAIHTPGGDLHLETNLSARRLLGAAAALRVRASPVPSSWLSSGSPLGRTQRVSIDRAVAELPFEVLVPSSPPAGDVLASAEIGAVTGRPSLNVYFEGVDAVGAGPLRLHEEPARAMPPASAARQYAVTVRDAVGRWTPGRHQLEWIEHGLYISLDAGGLELPALLDIAASLSAAVEP
jgi:hypothetical protein